MKEIAKKVGSLGLMIMAAGIVILLTPLSWAQNADVQGIWSLAAQGESTGCTEETPCREDLPCLCGTEVCGPFEMGDSPIYVLQPGALFSAAELTIL